MAIEKEYTLKLTTKQAQENVDELNKSLEAQVDLIDDIEKEIIGYEKQLKKTSKADLAGRKNLNDKIKVTKERLKDEKVALKDVNKEKKKANETLKESIANSKDYSGVLGIIDEKTGGAISGFTKLTSSLGGATKGFNLMKVAIIGTGIGALLIGIVALTAAFRGSEEGQNKFNKIMGVIGALTGNLVDLLADLGEGIINAFTNPVESLKNFSKSIKEFILDRVDGVIDSMGLLGGAIKKAFSGDFKGALKDAKDGFVKLNNNINPVVMAVNAATKAVVNFTKEQIKEGKAAAKVADMRAKADEIERNLIVERSKLESKIALLRLKSREEDKFTAEERKQALLDAQVLEDSLLDKETEYLELRRDAQIQENTFSRSNKENLTKEAEAIAAVNRQVASRANTARQVQREVNTISKQIQAQNKADAAAQDLKDKEKEDAKKLKQKELKTLKEQIREAEAVTEDERRALELEKVAEHYDRLIALAKAAGLSTVDLEKSKSNAIVKITENKTKEETNLEENKTQAALGLATNLLGSLSGLAKEGSVMAKGIAVASAIMNTYQGITAALSQTTDFTPTQSVRFANAAAVGITGFANVANILKTKPTQKTTPSPAMGGGGGVSIPAMPPAFNIVGQSDTNQLADAIGGQTQQPVQAFVVSSEVTTAQELDRNIIDGASIG